MTEFSARINQKLTRWLWNTMGTAFGFVLLTALLLLLVGKIG